MSPFIKCEQCNVEHPGDEKCVFAVYKRVIEGEEHYFCCSHHADEYERKRKKQKRN